MLKTTNFELKENGVVIEVLPEAFAIIRKTITAENDMGVAYIGIYRSETLARNHKTVKPLLEKAVHFKVDRTVNDRVTAYQVAKTPEKVKEYNHKTKAYEEKIVDNRFVGWGDYYSSNI